MFIIQARDVKEKYYINYTYLIEKLDWQEYSWKIFIWNTKKKKTRIDCDSLELGVADSEESLRTTEYV